MLRDYKGAVTVKIDAIAASAASVVAMAGCRVLMSPVAMLMLHDPSTIAYGNTKDMERAIHTLNEVKESIINAYAAKSGLSHSRISNLMSNETWMNAKKAVELGFADEILFDVEEPEEEEEGGEEETEEEEEKPGIHLEAQIYSTRQMGLTILNRLGVDSGKPPEKPPADTHTEPSTSMEEKPPHPAIGMDGTTEDGSVPYLILEKQLECLK